MFLDSTLNFSAAQAVTNTTNSDNILDLKAPRDLGIGNTPALQIIASINTLFTTTNSATLQVQFQGSTDSTTWTTYAESAAVAVANLTAGAKIAAMEVPNVPQGVSLPQYYRLNYAVGTGVFSAGKIDAWIGIGRSDRVDYPKGYNSSFPTP